MQPIVADGVEWSVGLSVVLSVCRDQKQLNQLRCRLSFGLRWAQGTMYWMGSRSPMSKGNFEGKGSDHYRDILPWTVQKRLNGSRCRLGCGLGWTLRSTH